MQTRALRPRRARLRRSDSSRPGYRRLRCGRGFRYLDPSGESVADSGTLERFKSLAIPPAWTDVWICPWPNGHLQALGTDEAGRRQYLYHPRFRELQEEAKHEHVLEVAARLPEARARITSDLMRRGLDRGRVLGCAARLLDLGFFRIGSDRHTATNGSYGLTTLLCEHVVVGRRVVEFAYHGKSGRDLTLEVSEPDARRALHALVRGREASERLFVYRDGRALRELRADELNGYLKDLFGTDVSAKDFRTWHATVLAAVGLAVSTGAGDGDGVTARRRAEARAVREVADYLGNTPAVCRASYINPRVFELYEQKRTIAPELDGLGRDTPLGQPATRGRVEAAVLRLLHDTGT